MQQGIASATAQVKQSEGSNSQLAEKALMASFGNQAWQNAHGGKENFKEFKEDKIALQDGSQASQYSWTDKDGVKHSATSTDDGHILMESTSKDGNTRSALVDPSTGKVDHQADMSKGEQEGIATVAKSVEKQMRNDSSSKGELTELGYAKFMSQIAGANQSEWTDKTKDYGPVKHSVTTDGSRQYSYGAGKGICS